jgi:hypothetical protein
MANEIDGELYPDNNSHTTARPSKWQLNGTTGVEEQVPRSGLTDLKAFIALSATAADDSAAVHASLVETMTEVASLAAYQATFDGAAKRTHLIAQPDGTLLYVHWQSIAAGYHEVAEVVWRHKRVAAAS